MWKSKSDITKKNSAPQAWCQEAQTVASNLCKHVGQLWCYRLLNSVHYWKRWIFFSVVFSAIFNQMSFLFFFVRKQSIFLFSYSIVWNKVWPFKVMDYHYHVIFLLKSVHISSYDITKQKKFRATGMEPGGPNGSIKHPQTCQATNASNCLFPGIIWVNFVTCNIEY